MSPVHESFCPPVVQLLQFPGSGPAGFAIESALRLFSATSFMLFCLWSGVLVWHQGYRGRMDGLRVLEAGLMVQGNSGRMDGSG